MAVFVLVHGAWHGAWCWERLEAGLARRGHTPVAVDLPVDDGSATFLDYRDAVLDAWPADTPGDEIVLVGHSLGAMVVPLVAAERQVRHSAYVCPVVPNVAGQPWDDAPEMGEPDAYGTTQHDDGSVTFDSIDEAVTTFYGACPPADARWAFERLRAQRSRSLWDRPYPLRELPPGPGTVVAGRHDRAIRLEFLRAVCRPRLGIDPVELDADHSPFLSATEPLADLLVAAAGK
jgi:pimeloyl-ACP methyl ester carboxylesterase